MILSPFWGTLIYAANLKLTGQRQKIVGVFVMVFIIQFALSLPLLGFDFPDHKIYPPLIFSRLLTMLFLLFPVWKAHFKNHPHQTLFPWLRVTLIVVVYLFVELCTYLYGFHIPFETLTKGMMGVILVRFGVGLIQAVINKIVKTFD